MNKLKLVTNVFFCCSPGWISPTTWWQKPYEKTRGFGRNIQPSDITKILACHFLNHAQSKLGVLLVATIPGYNILWYFWSLIVYPFWVIIDLFTFFIQSVMLTNSVSSPTKTLTLFCASVIEKVAYDKKKPSGWIRRHIKKQRGFYLQETIPTSYVRYSRSKC